MTRGKERDVTGHSLLLSAGPACPNHLFIVQIFSGFQVLKLHDSGDKNGRRKLLVAA